MIGQTIGRYTIESQLGEGGMGIVYKARDTQLGRAVAIKVLSATALVDADQKARFAREARAASALNHPNIVTLYDVGSEHGTDFIVMELVSGTLLDGAIPRTGLPIAQAMRFAIQIAGAMASAHEAGIIHRDLKPSNLMIADGSTIKILDFGIAKLQDRSEAGDARTTAATQPGATVGTPAYMSPEQAEGRAVDARTDIFSFGAVLYEMATGQRAFPGDSRLSVLAKILNEEPLPPVQLNRAIPPDLEKIILRCLRKDPARRYQTMADLKVALEDLLEDLRRAPVGSTRSPEHRVARSPSRRPLWIAAAVLALAAGGLGVWRVTRSRADAVPLQAIPLTSVPGQTRQPALSPDGNNVVFVWSGPQQDNQDIYVQQVGAGSPLRLTTDPANDFSPKWSPDGRSIAFLRRRGNDLRHELRVVAPLGGTERKVADLDPHNPIYRTMTLDWCPDSSCLIVTDGQGPGKPEALFVINVQTGEKRQLTFPPPLGAVDSDPALSPDGRSLVFRRDNGPFNGELYRMPLSAGITPAGDPVSLIERNVLGYAPVWLSNNREILFTARGNLWRLDVFSGKPPARVAFVGIDSTSPTIVPWGSAGEHRLVYARVFNDSNIWRVDTTAAGAPAGTPPRPAVLSTRADVQPALSPDGTRLAFFSSRSGEFELWASDLDGTNAMQLTTLASLPGFPRWSPDGKTIAFHGAPEGHADVITVPANGGKIRIITEGALTGGFPSFSRDGKWIYYTGPGANDLHALLWRIPAGGGTPERLAEMTGAIALESFDGRYLYFAENEDRVGALWRLPLPGGPPEKVLDGIVNGTYDLAENGVYFVSRPATQSTLLLSDRTTGDLLLRYFDFATRNMTTVAEHVDRFGLATSRDGRTILFGKIDASVDELMLVDHFR